MEVLAGLDLKWIEVKAELDLTWGRSHRNDGSQGRAGLDRGRSQGRAELDFTWIDVMAKT